VTRVVLILGSAPQVTKAAEWARDGLDAIVAINNAWQVRSDWDYFIHPEDFPADRHPARRSAGQQIVTAADYVPVQNRYGGFVYAGGTMAFTAGYWALGALQPQVLAYFGCDMVYPTSGNTHFYGTGRPDPLRKDISLRSLEAKSARLQLIAAAQGCACVNLSDGESRLVFPRASLGDLSEQKPVTQDISAVLAQEAGLDYSVPSGMYWKELDRFDPVEVDRLDAMWLACARGGL